MSYVRHYYHIVLTPLKRRPMLLWEIKRDIYRLIYGQFMRYNGCYVHRIGGMEDHVHILVSIPPKLSVSDVVKSVKQEVSRKIKEIGLINGWEGWSEGYSSFTCSYRELDMITQYIMNQEEHHRKVSFLEEYRKILLENGIPEDDPYFPR